MKRTGIKGACFEEAAAAEERCEDLTLAATYVGLCSGENNER